MSNDISTELLAIQAEIENRDKYNFINSVFPENDIPDAIESNGFLFSRHKYKKHIDFLAAGADFVERAFIAANRVGKSLTGCYELVVHATGLYPSWWVGKRFNRPVHAWLCGDRIEAIRSGTQMVLLERANKYPGERGTGLIPKDCIVDLKGVSNVPGAIGLYYIRHVSGGISTITCKTYSSGRTAFESAAVDVIMLDEECPRDIYSECLLRTLTTRGTCYLTFTPDSGLTDTVLAFYDNGDFSNGAAAGKFVVNVGWNDVPHIHPGFMETVKAAMAPHEIECRTKGVPFLGSGVIFPMDENEVYITPFNIPQEWPKAYGLDVGWNRTACLWGAIDPADGTIYMYSEYYRGQAETSSHAHAIKQRGDWIPGAIDPASRGRGQHDGQQIFEMYIDLGLDISKANNDVEASIFTLQQLFASQKIKIFNTCENLKREIRLYRRDTQGRIIKKDDHAIDALRYFIMSGRDLAIPPPIFSKEEEAVNGSGSSPVGGY